MLTSRFDQEQRYRDLYLVVQGRMWSEHGVRLVAANPDMGLDECGIDLDGPDTFHVIEAGNWGELLDLAVTLGVQISHF